MDYGMPDLDGIRAALEILSLRPVPIVLVTGHAEPEVVEQAAGATRPGSGSTPRRSSPATSAWW